MAANPRRKDDPHNVSRLTNAATDNPARAHAILPNAKNIKKLIIRAKISYAHIGAAMRRSY